MSQSIQCVHVLGARLFCCTNGGGRHAHMCDIEKELSCSAATLKILWDAVLTEGLFISFYLTSQIEKYAPKKYVYLRLLII